MWHPCYASFFFFSNSEILYSSFLLVPFLLCLVGLFCRQLLLCYFVWWYSTCILWSSCHLYEGSDIIHHLSRVRRIHDLLFHYTSNCNWYGWTYTYSKHSFHFLYRSDLQWGSWLGILHCHDHYFVLCKRYGLFLLTVHIVLFVIFTAFTLFVGILIRRELSPQTQSQSTTPADNQPEKPPADAQGYNAIHWSTDLFP